MTTLLPLALLVVLSIALLASVWFSLFVHECGHVVCALVVTTTPVTLQIGRGPVRLRQRFGRLVLIVCADHLATVLFKPVALTGLPPQSALSTRARIAVIGCGPLATALLAFLAGALLILGHPTPLGLPTLGVLAGVNAYLAVTNCVPFRPTRRWTAGEGIASDGLQILHLLRPPRPAHPFRVHDAVLPRPAYEVWHRIVGEADHAGKVPLVLVPGGPGLPHDYLEPLELLAGSGRRIILYDQAGCGRSTALPDPSLYSLAFFVEELDALRAALGLQRFHLWGTGWGATVALEYALAHPHVLESLTINGTGPSMADNLADLHELLADPEPGDDLLPGLPAKTRRLLREYRDSSPNADPAYHTAVLELLQRHFCRLDPWPPCLLASLRHVGLEMCSALVGANGTYPSGPLTEWDIRDRLTSLKLPVLVTGGTYDDVAPASIEDVAAAIPGARCCLFPHSSATPFLEEPMPYRKVLVDFLDKTDAQAETGRSCHVHPVPDESTPEAAQVPAT